jgi:pyruvate ferredoxin oxidoreductase gamma subunit
MYRIRLHGRGGHGMKTASRVLGTAFFIEGFEVQDAPRYGAERRGAPIFAYVRAARAPIHERGVIPRPDLIVIADETVIPVPGVLQGLSAESALLINSAETPDVWARRLNCQGRILTLPAEAEERAEMRFIGATCAGAAARLVGVISRASLERAIREELEDVGADAVRINLEKALAAYERLGAYAGCVTERVDEIDGHATPDWVELPLEGARIAAPDIHGSLTSLQVKTGTWRTMRPVIDHDHCHRCTWVCSTFCPDGAIGIDDQGRPEIDYDHCKGCLVCVAVCPHHAIRGVPEHVASGSGAAGDPS